MAGIIYDMAGRKIVGEMEELNPANRVVEASADKINQGIEDGLHHIPIVGDIIDFKNAKVKQVSKGINTVEDTISTKVNDEIGKVIEKTTDQNKLKNFKNEMNVKNNNTMVELINKKLTDNGYNPSALDSARTKELARRELELNHINELFEQKQEAGTLTPNEAKKLLKRSSDIINGKQKLPTGRAISPEEKEVSSKNMHTLHAEHRISFNKNFVGDLSEIAKKDELTDNDRETIQRAIIKAVEKDKTINPKGRTAVYVKSNPIMNPVTRRFNPGLVFDTDNKLVALKKTELIKETSPAVILGKIADAINKDESIPLELKKKILSNKGIKLKTLTDNEFVNPDNTLKTFEEFGLKSKPVPKGTKKSIRRNIMNNIIDNDINKQALDIDPLSDLLRDKFENEHPLGDKIKQQRISEEETTRQTIEEAQELLKGGTTEFANKDIPEDLKGVVNPNTGEVDITKLDDNQTSLIELFNKTNPPTNQIKSSEVRKLRKIIESAGKVKKDEFTDFEELMINNNIKPSEDGLSVIIPKETSANDVNKIKEILRPNVGKEIKEFPTRVGKINKIFTLKDIPSKGTPAGAIEEPTTATKSPTATITVPKEEVDIPDQKVTDLEKQKQTLVDTKKTIQADLKDAKDEGDEESSTELEQQLQRNNKDIKNINAKIRKTKAKETLVQLVSSQEEIQAILDKLPEKDKKFVVSGEEFELSRIPEEDFKLVAKAEERAKRGGTLTPSEKEEATEAEKIKATISNVKKLRERKLREFGIDPNGDFPKDEPFIDLDEDEPKEDDPKDEPFIDLDEDEPFIDLDEDEPKEDDPLLKTKTKIPKEDDPLLKTKTKIPKEDDPGISKPVLGAVAGLALGAAGAVAAAVEGGKSLQKAINTTKDVVDQSKNIAGQIKSIFNKIADIKDTVTGTVNKIKDLKNQLATLGQEETERDKQQDAANKKQQDQIIDQLKDLEGDITSLDQAHESKAQNLNIVNNPTSSVSTNLQARDGLESDELQIKQLEGAITDKTNRLNNNFDTMKRSLENRENKLSALIKANMEQDKRKKERIDQGVLKAMKPQNITLNIKNVNKPDDSVNKKIIKDQSVIKSKGSSVVKSPLSLEPSSNKRVLFKTQSPEFKPKENISRDAIIKRIKT